MLIILEPRISGSGADSVIERTGFPYQLRVEAEGFSGDIWVLWRDIEFEVKEIFRRKQILHLWLKHTSTAMEWFLSCVYGSPRVREREELWQSICSLADTGIQHWCLLGDFNAYLNVADKEGGSSRSARLLEPFQNCVDVCHLLDMGFYGPRFT